MQLELDDVAVVIADAVKSATAPLLARIDALEKREALHGRDGLPGVPGRDGKDVSLEDVNRMVAEAVQKAVALIPIPKDGIDGQSGTSVTAADVEPLIKAEVSRAFEAMPKPKDGTNGKDGTDGKDGASVTVQDIAPLVEEVIAKHVAAIPAPKDGRDGKDGINLAGALIDRDGQLVVTLSSGEAKVLGHVVGSHGKDGRDGIDGKDGATLNIDDLHAAEYDGDRTVTLVFQQQGKRVEFPIKFAVPMYRDVFTSQRSYEAGDIVTSGGSMWIAKRATMLRPDELGDGARDWTLCVKRGREGREGKAGKPGINGKDGKDLIGVDPDKPRKG